jgi:hypothetical protein
MRITIDTIPLWDAFRQTELCPLCFIQNRLETLYLEQYLGDSVMEPDVRVEVNKKGFCREHSKLLYEQKAGKLGLALMTHTNLLETMEQIHKQMEAMDRCCEEVSTPLKRFSGAKDINHLLEETAQQIDERQHSCVICERIDTNMSRYYETTRAMWSHDSDFRTLFEQCNGFCIPHWAALLK